jgi:hypothetical protein
MHFSSSHLPARKSAGFEFEKERFKPGVAAQVFEVVVLANVAKVAVTDLKGLSKAFNRLV